MDILFLIKKTVTFFVEPLGLILVSFALGLYFLYKYSHTKAKLFLSLSLFLLLFFSYPPISNGLIQSLENKYSKYDYSHNDIEYIHVLGSGHHDNPAWPLSSQIGNTSLKRAFEGISIFRKLNNPRVRLIFTGFAGPGNTITNAEINAKIARISNIDNRNLIINGNPKDTKEELIFSKSIVGDKPFVLVTSASHMPRAMNLFKNMGMSPIAAPTDFRGKNKSFLSAPSIGSLEKSRNATHELLGIAWAYLIRQN
ncbi:MAG: DUF218 domain-containing protein [Candidatus Ruthia sp.]|nr:DUF218 domain-containing protein [Candidatus Ruthturnera sp.]MBT4923083.1 DUF218 domain-containing protein [Candidatus Thioglobus sp.]